MIDFAALTRPASPNTYLLAPDGFCPATTDAPAPTFSAAPAAVFAAVEAAVAAMDRVSPVQADPDRRTLSFVQRSKLIGFKDDVDVAVVPAGDGAALAVYSASRVGYSDMGANKKRVDALVAMVRDRLA